MYVLFSRLIRWHGQYVISTYPADDQIDRVMIERAGDDIEYDVHKPYLHISSALRENTV